jgi:prepilin-type N-terminal cleavage/methylation domain-containing protein
MTKSSPPPAERAFTLIELLVVIATLGILVAIATPAFKQVLERAKVTKELSNLRQIGAGTQMYMSDNNGVVFSTTTSWMAQLNPKYISSWKVFESPFDKRASSEAGDGSTAVSFGINPNIWGQSADKVTKPVTFIVLAPAQAAGASVTFQGTAATAPPGMTVNTGGIPAASNPGGTATSGTHNNRTKINVLCADWHAETMSWSGTGPAFTNMSDPGNDPDAPNRWCPQLPCP